MHWDFPVLERPSIFIAAPGDVKYLRDTAVREIDRLTAAVADGHGLVPYNWLTDKAQDGFVDWIPAQGQIPRPDDNLCQAVICIFGERLGSPLPADFPIDGLDGIGLHRPGGSVHGVASQFQGENGFRLTGTVFECLAALSTHRRARPAHRAPLLILFAGDSSVAMESEPLAANWGLGRLYEKAEKKFGKRSRAMKDWLAYAYEPEILELRAFLEFLQGNGIFPRFVHDEEAACEQVRAFLARELDLAALPESEPFKGLNLYHETDLQVFFGREEERRQAVAELSALFEDSTRPTAYGIVGGSGVGKSSFLRAGLLAHCRHRVSAGYFTTCALRPTELVARPVGSPLAEPVGAAVGALISLFVQALRAIEPDSDHGPSAERLAEFRDAIMPTKAVDWLLGALDRRGEADGEEWRLIIGLDQFEELVDQLADAHTRTTWELVVRFLDAAAKTSRIAIVYTLQTNRIDLILRDPILGPLWTRGGQLFVPFPDHSLNEIINQPFACLHMSLDPPLVTALRKNIMDFATRADPASQGSLLPLVSLTLQNLRNAALATKRAERPAGTQAEARSMLSMGEFGQLLDVGKAIANLANEAALAAEAAAGPDWSKETVGDLLRQLIRIRDLEGERFSLPLARLPATGAISRLAEELVKRRILIPEPDSLHRLVHEAVCHHWPAAADWLNGERRVLRLASLMGYRAREWRAALGRDVLAEASRRDVDEAAEVLATWFPVLQLSVFVQPDDALIRDYGLALLTAHPSPLRCVDGFELKSPHVYLAVQYRQLELLKRYIESEPTCVQARRTDERTPLFAAAALGFEEIVDVLLASGAPVDDPDQKQWRAIHFAASNGHESILRRLSAAGADVNAKGQNEITSLILAAGEGHERVVRALFDLGAQPNLFDREGWHALHTAAGTNRPGVIDLLLANGADPNAVRPSDGWTPLVFAAYFNSIESAERLLDAHASFMAVAKYQLPYDAYAQVSPWGAQRIGSPLQVACDRDHPKLVRLLLARGADPNPVLLIRTEDGGRESFVPNKQGWFLLHLVADVGQPSVIQALVENGAAIDCTNADAVTPLDVALRRERLDVAKELVALGATFDARTRSRAIRTALETKKLQSALFLLESGDLEKIDNEFQNATPLHVAVEHRAAPIVKWLVQRGYPLDAQDDLGETALHRASRIGDVDSVRLLLEALANGEARDFSGRTPLLLAVVHGKDAVASEFIRRSVSLDLADHAGLTPLHVAARLGNVELTLALLASGVTVGTSDAAGWTALHWAARGNRTAIVGPLLSAGADVDALSRDPPRTPLGVAIEVSAATTAAALREAGAIAPAAVAPLVGQSPGERVPTASSHAFELALSTTRLTSSGTAVRSPLARDDFLSSPHPPEAEELLRNAVLQRDDYACRACGFRSSKFQTVACQGRDMRDLDDLVTLCSFCGQCSRLDEVTRMQSGVLIDLPEISQMELHHALREIFIARITQGEIADLARAVFERLRDRAGRASHRIGTSDPSELARRLEQQGAGRVAAIDLEGIRLLPLDRRVVRIDDLEYNQFPQMLAFWRSKDGPFGNWRATGLPRIAALQERLGHRE